MPDRRHVVPLHDDQMRRLTTFALPDDVIEVNHIAITWLVGCWLDK